MLAADSFDVVVYGGTSGGVTAAIQASRMGKSVVLIEPTKHLGGLTTGGLGATDIGNKRAIGGMSREFYQRVYRYYQAPERWTNETRESYIAKRPVSEDTMWTFEPHVATQIFADMIMEANVPVVYQERLDLRNGVNKNGTQIRSIAMESGRTFEG